MLGRLRAMQIWHLPVLAKKDMAYYSYDFRIHSNEDMQLSAQ